MITLPENVISLTRMSAAASKAFGAAHPCQHCSSPPHWMLVYHRVPPSLRSQRRAKAPVRSFDLLCDAHAAEAKQLLRPDLS